MKKWVVASCLLWLVGVGFAGEADMYTYPGDIVGHIVVIDFLGICETDSEWEQMKSLEFKQWLKKNDDIKDIQVKNKLTKKDLWFCSRILEKYDISENECYRIETFCLLDRYFTVIWLRIINNEQEFEWIARRIFLQK